MLQFDGEIPSKLPQVGLSIFAVMSKMAAEHQAVNLSQGFPDFPIAEQLIQRVNHYMKKGFNQYAPMPGIKPLRDAISEKVFNSYKLRYDSENEITVTAGATQALYTAITAFIREGDEVIIFEPAYDSYAPAVKSCGGMVKYASLTSPDFKYNWQEVRQMITNRTRMIIINSPHNPTGSLLTAEDLQQLEKLTCQTDILVLSDEVYEHLVFDGKQHESVCRYPELARRSLVVASFGKTFHATGWKLGYILAPANLMQEFRKLHQFVVFAINTPIQYAIADFLKNTENFLQLGDFYQQKRDAFLEKVKPSRFKMIPSYGTYFQLLDYAPISDLPEMEFAKKLIKEYGIAAVPISPFYNRHNEQHLLRFCFAKTDETLTKAAEILCKI
ncbi:MAG: methionine aminotransferase [Bacteroidetes bacterium]|jgi:methionine aminotransferase|nr:methionine aminotransferase [Bacteroidota bacterium]